LRIHSKKESACKALKNAISKYGLNSFKKEILHSGVPIADLPSLETNEIARHDTLAPKGYNLTPGGEHNQLALESSRKKVSDAKKLYWQRQGAEARRLSNSRMMSDEARAKVAATKRESARIRLQNKMADIPESDREEFERVFWDDYQKKRLYRKERNGSMS
jgi:hypothetical protein